MSLNYEDRQTIERVATTIADGLKAKSHMSVDLLPIADAIREGLASIATAIEYNGELEDRRLREVNRQGE